MPSARRAITTALASVLALAAVPGAAHAADPDARYQLVHGCYALTAPDGRQAVKQGDHYALQAGKGEPLRMQATDLGAYLLYGSAKDFLSTGGASAATPLPASDFTVEPVGEAFKLVAQTGTRLVLDGADTFSFTKTEGCATYPEAPTDVEGAPTTGPTAYGTTSGLLDAHMHLMGFEFLGGKAHCGRPWHRYGVEYALDECEDGAAGNQATTALETALGGGSPGDDPQGWPTFKSWPSKDLLAHEGSYYTWLERAWKGGLRTYVNLFVENHALCSLFPLKKNSCNEMDSVRLQAVRLKQLEDYIDAQEGGPGKGWFRIVSDPFEARRVENSGKLAVVPGIEVSTLFDCGLQNEQATCTDDQIDQRLDEAYRLGVRDMELTNKFDNAFAGVAGDAGQQGVVVNAGNKLETGSFWKMQTCTNPDRDVAHDREQYTAPVQLSTVLAGSILAPLGLEGQTPAYPPGPHCNVRGLTEQGDHLVRAMVDHGMIVDPDHLDVVSRNAVLSILEAKKYSGVVSSHTWSTADAYPRILGLGGVITPIQTEPSKFIEEYKQIKAVRDPKYLFGFGYGADINGFAHQASPSAGSQVRYPFTSLDGKQTIAESHAGTRTWDYNKEGVAHYGLYLDWLEDIRQLAGPEIIRDMLNGSEAYLQMWERAVGVAPAQCRSARLRFTARGVGLMRLGDPAEDVLRAAGQPTARVGRVYSYCASGPGKGTLSVVMDSKGKADLAVSTAPRHRVAGLGRGSRASAIRRHVAFGSRTLLSRRVAGGKRTFYAVRAGRVRYAGVASGEAARSPKALRAQLGLAGLK